MAQNCQCGAPIEDSIHYTMMQSQNERDCLLRSLRESLKNIETLLFGNQTKILQSLAKYRCTMMIQHY